MKITKSIEKKDKKREKNLKIRAAGNIHKNQQQTLRGVEQCDELKQEEGGGNKGERDERQTLNISSCLRTYELATGLACPCGLFYTLSFLECVNPFYFFYNFPITRYT